MGNIYILKFKSFFRIDIYDIFDEICAAGLTHYYITEA
jgi:hypothetical protein